jgi:DTW domain-containing protein
VCSSIPLVDNRTSVLVLQHPRERTHPIGTARFAALGLRNARVEVAWNANSREEQPPSWLPAGAALLYPAPGARDLRELPAHERPQHLVVLDGTWHTARSLYRDKRWLHALPHYRFLPSAPGRYRLRREPQLDYVSTIEAIVEALRILEPDTQGLNELLAAFDGMIDQQLALRRIGTGRLRVQRRPLLQRRTPRVLVDDFQRLVVVYGEPSRPQLAEQREFVYFAAQAIGSAAQFERVMLPATGLPDAQHLEHMGLAPADFASALSRSEFAAAWRAFLDSCGFAPIVAAWNQRTLDLLAATTCSPVSRVSLKSAYRSVFGASEQSVDEAAARQGLCTPPTTLRGRAALRMSSTLAVTRFLHARALGPEPDPVGCARAVNPSAQTAALSEPERADCGAQ